jgi:Spy/CpxP family protein refolding chaperone
MGPGAWDANLGRPGVGQLLRRRQALQLTDEQVERFEELEVQLQAGRETAMAELREHQNQLRTAWQAESPDVERIREHMLASSTIWQSHRADAMAAALEARSLLTDEQRGRVQGWRDAARVRGARGVRPGHGRRGIHAPRGRPVRADRFRRPGGRR